MSSSALIDLVEAEAGYGKTTVLQDVRVEVRSGEIVALLGANGAGKTTTLRVLSGILPLRSGRLYIEGRVQETHDPRHAVRIGIAHCPQGRRIFPTLTVRENVELGASLLPREERASAVNDALEPFSILRERLTQQGGTLSGGEQQMLAISRALACRPRVLMLDEPSLGLAPIMVARVAELIRDLRDRGTTILLVEQNVALALSLADRAYVLESGVVTLSGEAASLANDPRVRDAYLGSGRYVRRRSSAPGPVLPTKGGAPTTNTAGEDADLLDEDP